MRKRVCIIVFSPFRRDARVLRHAEYLSSHYDVTVIAHGEPPEGYESLEYKAVPASDWFEHLLTIILLLAARLIPRLYEVWYWQKKRNRLALEYAVASKPDAIHANDWSALPVAVEAAKKTGAKVVLDLHEYAPRQSGQWWWLTFFSPATRYILHQYVPHVEASMTVCEPIAAEYKREFGLDPIVVMNAPKRVPVANDLHPVDPRCIHLIHHGSADPERRLERMIESLALAALHFRLHFMLVGDAAYIRQLKALAHKLAPGRVEFHEPVHPSEIVAALARYDMGFYVLTPYSYNGLVALPNKFFDFVNAGLAVCIGPSPSMAELVERYGFGCVASSFEPRDVAQILNELTVDQIEGMRRHALEAAKSLNADHEMARVVELYDRLLTS